MTILCEADQPTASALLASLIGDVQTVPTLPDVALTIAADPRENLVVIGGDYPLHDVLAFAKHVRAEQPHIAIILLRNSVDPEIVEQADRDGVRYVVPTGDSGAILAACRGAVANDPLPYERAISYQGASAPQGAAMPYQGASPHQMMPPEDADPPTDEARKPGRVVTVFATKGGCGKTTVATNLAVALNGDGSRRVCLVDLDLEFGDVAIMLRLTPSRTLIDAVSSEFIGADTDRVEALLTPLRPGMDCVLAPVEPGDAEKVPPSLVTMLLGDLRQRYDYVVVDTPAQFSEHVLAALDASDHHVLLTTPEVTALKNLRLTLDMLDLLSYSRDARSIVFNRSDDKVGLSAKDVEETIKSPIAVHVPSSRDVPASINMGVPLTASKPDHPVSQAIRTFAERTIIGEPVSRRRFGRRGSKTARLSA